METIVQAINEAVRRRNTWILPISIQRTGGGFVPRAHTLPEIGEEILSLSREDLETLAVGDATPDEYARQIEQR